MGSDEKRKILEVLKEKKIVIKRVTLKDTDIIKEVIELERKIFNGKGNINFWLLKAFVRYGVVYILSKDEKIIAVTEYMQVLNEKELFLYGCFTVEEHRKKGYGKILLEYGELEMEKMGINTISLTVDPENKLALKLYEKLGYEKTAFLKDEYGAGVDREQLKKTIKMKK